jgi:hypothetical protein
MWQSQKRHRRISHPRVLPQNKLGGLLSFHPGRLRLPGFFLRIFLVGVGVLFNVAEEKAKRALVAARVEILDGLSQKELLETAAKLTHALSKRGYQIAPLAKENAGQ